MKQLFEQLDFGTYGAVVSRFFIWWGRELYVPLPDTIKAFFSTSGPIDLSYGSEVKQGESVNLILPQMHYLEKTIRLPRSAEKSLSAAMRLQIERLSPLSVDEILSGWTVSQKNTDQIDVSLKMAKSAEVREEIDRIEAGGSDVVDIYSVEQRTQFKGCDYLIRARAKKHLMAFGFYMLVCALLLSSPLILSARMDHASDRAEMRVSALRSASTDLIKSRQLIAVHQNKHDFLSEQLKAPDPLTQLDRLTKALPKSAWLQSAKVDGRELTIVGETGNAAELAVLVGGHAFVKSVSLRSVNPSGNMERFEMRLTLKPGGDSDDE